MPQSRGQTLTILVVEDDVAAGELMRSLLNQVPGWGATGVHDAAAAREVFRHVTVEVLVLDINLPGISGLELLLLLRQDPEWDDPPVILISSEPSQPGLQATVERGEAVRFIKKPFDIDELIRGVEAAAEAYLAPR
jgi:DNA-binding response OmpR family regulator